MNIISGLYSEGQIRVGIVATRFNEVVVSKLIDGAADGLSRHGVDMDTVDLAWVPGAFEVPLTAKRWRRAVSMTRFFALAPLFVERRTTMLMCLRK